MRVLTVVMWSWTAAAIAASPAKPPVKAPKPAAAKTCAEGNLDHCYAEALQLYFGEAGVTKDTERGLALFKENCAKGHAASCNTAEALSAPPPKPAVPPDAPPLPTRRPRADLKTMLTEGCEGGDSAKCLDLARRYGRGQPPAFEKDPARALELLKKACDGTSGEACRTLAKDHLKGKEAKATLARAVELDGTACEAGDTHTCWRHGNAYLRGEGVKLDPERAREIFSAACTRKDAYSCTTLGDIFHHAQGVHRDRKTAFEYYRQGCELGAGHGCYGQALVVEALVSEDRLSQKDLAMAAELFAKACEKYTPGCWKLAGLYNEGRGVPKDKAKAKELLELACTRGHRQACAGKYPERRPDFDAYAPDSPRPGDGDF